MVWNKISNIGLLICSIAGMIRCASYDVRPVRVTYVSYVKVPFYKTDTSYVKRRNVWETTLEYRRFFLWPTGNEQWARLARKAVIEAEAGRLQRAEKAFMQCLKENRKEKNKRLQIRIAVCSNNLGLIRELKGNASEAKHYYAKAMARLKDDRRIQYNFINCIEDTDTRFIFIK